MNPIALVFYSFLALAAILVSPWFIAVGIGALVAVEIVDPVFQSRQRAKAEKRYTLR